MQLPLGFVIELFLVSYHAFPHSLLNYAASFTFLSPLINSHSVFLKFVLHTLRNILIFLCMHALKRKKSCPTLRPHGLQPARLLCPWDSPGKNTGVGCHALLQRIFLTQGSNPRLLCLLHWRAGSYNTSATWGYIWFV